MRLRTDRHARMQLLDVMLENGINRALGTQTAEQVNHQCRYSNDRSDARLPPCKAFVNVEEAS